MGSSSWSHGLFRAASCTALDRLLSRDFCVVTLPNSVLAFVWPQLLRVLDGFQLGLGGLIYGDYDCPRAAQALASHVRFSEVRCVASIAGAIEQEFPQTSTSPWARKLALHGSPGSRPEALCLRIAIRGRHGVGDTRRFLARGLLVLDVCC